MVRAIKLIIGQSANTKTTENRLIGNQDGLDAVFKEYNRATLVATVNGVDYGFSDFATLESLGDGTYKLGKRMEDVDGKFISNQGEKCFGLGSFVSC